MKVSKRSRKSSSSKSSRESASGRNLQKHLGEASLAAVSRKGRELASLARATKREHLPFCQIAVGRRIINDTLSYLERKGSVVTIESLIGATLGGEKSFFIVDPEHPDSEVAGEIVRILDGIEKDKDKYEGIDRKVEDEE